MIAVNKFAGVVLVIILGTSCTEKSTKAPNPKDSSSGINIYPTDSNVPVDTDNHNVGNISTVTLDSPVGPPKHLEPSKRVDARKQ